MSQVVMHPLDEPRRYWVSLGPAKSLTSPHAESSISDEDAGLQVCHMILKGELAALSLAAICARRSGHVGACQARRRLTGKPSGIVARRTSGHTLKPAWLLTYQREIECRH
jgi:hypothetical protein